MYSRLTLLLIPLSPCVVRDRGRRSLSGYETFRCLAFGSAAEHQSPSAGGEREFISIPPLPSIFKNALIPLLRVDRPAHPLHLFYCSNVPPYVGTSMTESKPPPIPAPNEERWITAGSFALVLPLQDGTGHGAIGTARCDAGTSPRPPLPSTNGEGWIPAGPFALFLPLRSWRMAASQMVASSPTRPRRVGCSSPMPPQ